MKPFLQGEGGRLVPELLAEAPLEAAGQSPRGAGEVRGVGKRLREVREQGIRSGGALQGDAEPAPGIREEQRGEVEALRAESV